MLGDRFAKNNHNYFSGLSIYLHLREHSWLTSIIAEHQRAARLNHQTINSSSHLCTARATLTRGDRLSLYYII